MMKSAHLNFEEKSESLTISPQFVGTLTVGAVIGTAFLVKGLLGGLIDKASGEIKEVLEQIDKMLNELIDKLGATYKDLLDTTLDQLDEFTRGQFERLYALLQKLSAELEVGLDNLTDRVLNILREITTQVRVTLAQVKDLVTVAIRGAMLVLDKAAFNIAFIAAVVIFALGLLIFIWLLFTRNLPEAPTSRLMTIGLIVLFLVVFGALLLPRPRAYALTWAGFGNRVKALSEPMIIEVRPRTLVIGKTEEIVLIGARLTNDGRPPTVEIAGITAPATGGNEIVAVDVTGLDLSNKTGTQTLALRTADNQATTTALTIRARRRLPHVTSWLITPIGKVSEPGGNNIRTGIGCRAPETEIGKTKECNFDELIQVDPDYELDMNRPAQLGRNPEGAVIQNSGEANRGFEEIVTTYTRRKGSPRDPTRQIDFYRIANTPVGIKVSGSARNDAQKVGDPGKRGEFKATYTVYGRKVNPNAKGTEWSFSGVCEISGTVICGSYPYPDQLSRFLDGPKYLVQVTFTDSEGKTVARSGTLTPNDSTSLISAPLQYEDAEGQLQSSVYELRIVDRSVQVFGPDLGPVGSGVRIGPRLDDILRKYRRQPGSIPRGVALGSAG